MKKHFSLLLVVFILISCEKEQGPGLDITHGSFTDGRDGKIYSTVIIDGREWMAENLAFLPFVTRAEYGSETEQCCYVYNYTSDLPDDAKSYDSYKKFGTLYNWTAANNACPDGWHLPTKEDWKVLIDNLGNNGYGAGGNPEYVSKALCSESGWAESRISASIGFEQNDNNSTGFSVKPGGQLPYNGVFSDIDHSAFFWSSSQTSEYSPTAYLWEFHYTSRQPDRAFSSKVSAFSVRCIRD